MRRSRFGRSVIDRYVGTPSLQIKKPKRSTATQQMGASVTTGKPGSLSMPQAFARTGAGMPRVLLVVADINVAHVMKSSLDRNGFEIDTALTEEVGLRLYRDIGHDAVIIDQGVSSGPLAERMLERSSGQMPFILLVREKSSCTMTAPAGTEQLDKPLSLRYLVARLTGEFGYFPI